MVNKFFVAFWIGLLIMSKLNAQVQARIEWLADSIALGRPTPLSFSVRYPVGYAILFPDSSKDFLPFELHHKEYFNTRIENHYAVDSAVYYILSFQIDSLQRIQLPFGYVYKLDTTFLKSEVVSIPFQRRVYEFSDETPYLFSPQRLIVPIPPNYFFIVGVCLLGIAVVVLLGLIFRRRFIRWVLLYRAYKEWRGLLSQLNRIMAYTDVPKLIYELNFAWKEYLGCQDAVHPSSLVSKEFQIWIQSLPFLENREVFIALCELEERVFYASEKIEKETIVAKKQSLVEELEKVYRFKRKEIKKRF